MFYYTVVHVIKCLVPGTCTSIYNKPIQLLGHSKRVLSESLHSNQNTQTLSNVGEILFTHVEWQIQKSCMITEYIYQLYRSIKCVCII